MGFLPLLPPHDEKVLLFHRKIEGGEGRDQHWLMKESALKKKKKAATAKKSFVSCQRGAIALPLLSFPLPPPRYIYLLGDVQ